MLFVLHCLDRPDSAALRQEHRPAHLAYLEAAGDRIIMAGPYLNVEGTHALGSLIIIECSDRAEAEAFSINDPYRKADLFEMVAVIPWRKTLPKD